MIPVAPILEVGSIDVGGVDIDGAASGAPQVNDFRLPAAAWKLAWGNIGSSQPGVDIHGQRVFCFSSGSDLVYITAIVPRHEHLVGVRSGTEDFGPSAGGFVACCIPDLTELREERITVLPEILSELGGNRAIEGLIGGGRAIARIAEHADFVFDLHHQYCVVAAVDFTDVTHECGKGARIGLQRGCAKGTEN